MKKKTVWILLLLVAVGGLVFFITRRSGEETQEQPEETEIEEVQEEEEGEEIEEQEEALEEEDTEEDTSGIPPWQYSVLKDYFENTDNPSYEDVANKMSEDLGDLTLENYMEAKNKFDAEDGEESVDLEEVELMDVDDGEEKEIAVASKKVTEIFPELNSYQKADMPK